MPRPERANDLLLRADLAIAAARAEAARMHETVTAIATGAKALRQTLRELDDPRRGRSSSLGSERRWAGLTGGETGRDGHAAAPRDGHASTTARHRGRAPGTTG